MLKTIDDVPWQTISHAYGTCEDVPRMLRNLAAGNERGSEAIDWLCGGCFHQETHYDANAWVLPYLLEIVAAPANKHRHDLFRILLDWICGDDALEPPPSERQKNRRRSQWFAGWKYRLINSADRWRELKRRTLGAAWAHRGVLTRLLKADPDPWARAACSALLSSLVDFGLHCGGSYVDDRRCPWCADAETLEIADVIHSAARGDPETAVRVTCRLSLGVMRDVPQAAQYAAEVFRDSVETADSVAAGLACLTIPAPATPEMVKAIVEGLLGDLEQNRSLFDSPWFDDRRGDETPEGKRRAVQRVLTSWINASVHPVTPLVTLLHEELQGSSPTLRRRAVEGLAALNEWDEVAAVLDELRVDRDPLVRAIAATGVWRRPNLTDGRPLLESFQAAFESDDVNLRRSVLDLLISLQRELSNVEQQRSEARALNESEPVIDGWPARIVFLPLPFAAPSLFEMASRESNVENRERLCDLFWRAQYAARGAGASALLPDETSLRRLLVEWMHDGDLVAAASEICPALAEDEQRELASVWLKMIREGHPKRCAIVRSLGRLKAVSVVDDLVRLMEDNPDSEFRESAMFGLRSQPESHRALPMILSLLRTGSFQLVRSAICHFSMDRHNLESSEAVQTLLQLFRDDAVSSDGTRLRSLLPEALGVMRVHRDAIAAALIDVACTDHEESICSLSAQKLAESFAEEPQIVNFGDRIRHEGGQSALRGFVGAFRTGTELPTILEEWIESLLAHGDHEIRAMAVRLLQWRPASASRQRKVAELLRDPEGDVRATAVWWEFPDMAPGEYIPVVLEMLNPPEPVPHAFSALVRRADTQSILEGARRCFGAANGELIETVCNWVIANGGPAVPLDDVIFARLSDDSLSPLSVLHILRACHAMNPSNRERVLRHLPRIEDCPAESIRGVARQLRTELEKAI